MDTLQFNQQCETKIQFVFFNFERFNWKFHCWWRFPYLFNCFNEVSWGACDRTAPILLENHLHCSFKTCKWYHGIIIHISTTLRPVCVLWAWRSGVTNYWKIIGHCGLGGSYLFSSILSLSVLVMMTISRGSELSAQPGGLRLSDNSQQNSYSIMFQSNLRVECFMSALLTLCFDIPIPISGVKSQRGSFKDSSCCKLKVQQFRILQINEE